MDGGVTLSEDKRGAWRVARRASGHIILPLNPKGAETVKARALSEIKVPALSGVEAWCPPDVQSRELFLALYLTPWWVIREGGSEQDVEGRRSVGGNRT